MGRVQRETLTVHTPWELKASGLAKLLVRKQSTSNERHIVHARALTPFRAKLVDRSTPITTVAVFGTTVYGIIAATTQAWEVWVAGAALVATSYPAAGYVYRRALARSATFEFTPDTFGVRRLIGWKRFDRRHPHAFSLLPHDKARDEHDEHDLATRKAQLKGEAIQKKRYYGESYHLSFDYLGQRHDLMTVYGHKEALAIQAELAAADQIMDGIARKGLGITLRPDDDWSEQPGDIPDLA